VYKVFFAYILLTCVFWFTKNPNIIPVLLLVSATILGKYFLDIDHIINWYVVKFSPGIEAMKNGNIKQIIEFVKKSEASQSSLILHHFYFHIVLLAISIFIFTSNSTIFGRGLLLAINFHLFEHIWVDAKTNPEKLQTWYFARMNKQLPIRFLPTWAKINLAFLVLFSILLTTGQ